MTSQVLFDSHVELLLDAAVSFVNELTDGERRGKPFTAPAGAALPAAARRAIPSAEPRIPESLPADDAELLAQAARVMRDVFEAVEEGRVDDAAAAVNRLLRESGARPQLDRVPGEPWALHFHGSDDSYGIGWTSGCATALALAVGSALAGRLGVCRAPHCDRVYVDMSKNSVRQFCSAPCQSRVKAAAFRARQSAAAKP
ncbi:CGNR zinc finger domain-containing protein [Catenulispora yoronensis]|uniref:CGNR zinc finger domain-containing protein n=1 Tax=Catenulispora yoronensis TaxID=450799 RepID=UPI0031D0B451